MQQNYTNFLDILLSQRKCASNPFNNRIISEFHNFQRPSFPFNIYEECIDKEIRCPICLARVGIATKPSSCNHVFCKPCISNWNKLSNKCPVCRKIFDDIFYVDIQKPEFNFQGELFCSIYFS